MKKLGLIIFFFVLATSTLAEWYPGIIHAHSTYSDGDMTPAMLLANTQKAGAKFLGVTDHLEQIDNEKKLYGKITDDCGFEKYLSDYNQSDPLLCLPGVEIMTKGNSHILALANYERVTELATEKYDQQELINLLNEKDALPVVAHPSLKKYWFDRDKAKGICGFEFFNENATDTQKTLEMYLTHPSAFVIGGCDTHVSAQGWPRRTFVWVEGALHTASLLEGISSGKTYAANNGAYFKNLSYIPGRNVIEVNRPKFEIEIGFQKETSSKKTLNIYRDGKIAFMGPDLFSAGKKEYSYQWEDKVCSSSKHYYVIEVVGCLVTSPINLLVKAPKPEPPKPKVVTKPAPTKTSPKPDYRSVTTSGLYRDSVDESIKATLKAKLKTRTSSTKIIMTNEDMNFIRNYDGDRRVGLALVDLAERHILAVRIKFGYHNQTCWISRETEYRSVGDSNISAHFTGQGYDIFWADGVDLSWQISANYLLRQKAHKKIRQLLAEIFALGKKDSNLVPTQMMIYDQSDVNAFLSDLDRFFGPASERGDSGMWANQRMWDRIHIGY